MFKTEEIQTYDNDKLVEMFQSDDFSRREKNEILKTLISNNMGAITNVIKSYQISHKTSWDELLQAARRGMYFAATRYDKERGNKFITFAMHEIKNAVSDSVNAAAGDYCSNYYSAHMKFVRKAITEIQKEKGESYEPETAEIHDWILTFLHKDIAETTIESCLEGLCQTEHASLENIFAVSGIDPAFDESKAMQQINQMELKRDISLALSQLPEVQRLIVGYNHGLIDGKIYTFDKIAKKLNERPDLVKQNNSKLYSAFYCEKYSKEAISNLQHSNILRHHGKIKEDAAEILSRPDSISLNSSIEIMDTVNDTLDCLRFEDIPDYDSSIYYSDGADNL